MSNQNTQKLKDYQKRWRESHKESIKVAHRKWVSENPEKIKEHSRKSYIKNKEKINLSGKKWRENNKQSSAEKKKLYYQKTKEESRKYQLNKLHTDPQYRLTKNLRTRLYLVLKRNHVIKSNKTIEYLGCSKEYLKSYLQSKFTEGMSWENYGKWHIDHIRPISTYDLTKEENIYEASNYTNLQPLWAKDNLSKSKKYEKSNIKRV